MSLIVFRRPDDFMRCLLTMGWTLTEIDTSAIDDGIESLTVLEWTPPPDAGVASVCQFCADYATRNAVLLDQLAESQAARRELELRVASMVLGARSDNDAR